jgi:hypothetical protein
MRYLVLTVLALALVPVASSAQARKDNWENLKQLKAGHKMQVVDMSLNSWQGKFVSVSEETITIRELRQQQEITVERAKVFRVTDLERSRRGRNALIGLCIGGVIGGGLGARSEDLAPMGGVLIGAWFGGMGAAAGGVIPYPRPTVYRVKQQP